MTFRPARELLEDRTLLTAYIVDTIADDPLETAADTDGLVSLREAIQAANTNAVFGDAAAGAGGVDDTITFAPSLSGQTIILGGDELTISDDLIVTGLGSDNLTISGDNASRVFYIETGVTAHLVGLTIADGAATAAGGIYNLGTLVVSDSVVTGNTAESEGGAIFNVASLTITNSTISHNYADFEGGGVWSDGVLEVVDTTFLENASWSRGAGIRTYGAATIADSIFTRNATEGTGGAISNGEFGELTVTNSTFSENSSRSWGGAIHNGADRFPFPNLGSFDVNGSTFVGNSASSGGAIWSVGDSTIVDSTFSENSARSWGGAIANEGRTMIVRRSTMTNNTAGSYGGAIDNTAWGFGVTLKLFDSTLAGNSAGRDGGAIENLFGTVEIVNTTISGNSAGGLGGAIDNWSGTVHCTNATIVFNRADADGNGSGSGGGIHSNSATAITVLNNTLLAGNLRGAAGSDDPDDISGNPTNLSGVHNLVGDAATAGGLLHGDNGNIVGNAGVGTIDITTVLDTNLVDNGGPTWTHALVPGSPAINGGDNSLAVDGDGAPLLFDQRGTGFPRVVGGTSDIGALEAQPRSVQIVVKPGSDSSAINLVSNGVIAVAILSTDGFDAALVDASTVVFAGASAVQSSLNDVDGDGDLDMVLHFRIQDTNLAEVYAALLADDSNSSRQSVAVSLEGTTIHDEVFAGEDFADLFLAGNALRELLDELALAGLL